MPFLKKSGFVSCSHHLTFSELKPEAYQLERTIECKNEEEEETLFLIELTYLTMHYNEFKILYSEEIDGFTTGTYFE